MQVKSPVLITWKLFALGSFLGCLLFFLFFDKIQQNQSSIVLELAPPLVELLDTQTTKIKPTYPSNSTIINLHNEPNITHKIIVTSKSTNPCNVTIVNPTFKPNNTPYEIITEKQAKIAEKECNMFDGKWVYKEELTPSYDAMSCPFLERAVRCQENGRSDNDYVKWQWEATNCEIPLFNGEDMIQRLRNKRVIIVGDSINRNMWESLACLIYTSIPSSRAIVDLKSGGCKTLKAMDYNFTLDFYMSPFLTELDKDHQSGRKVLILDKISTLAAQWRGADIMIFNSDYWWTHSNDIKGWDIFQYRGRLIEDMPRDLAFKRAMRTWTSWIKINVDPKKSKVYFRGISPSHNRRKSDQWCYNATQPMNDDSYRKSFPEYLVDVVESMINKMSKLNVRYLNITKLSQRRKDAHPSIFTTNLMTIHNKKIDDGNNLSDRADCSHWCLPGLPDTWNRVLYASILFDIAKKS